MGGGTRGKGPNASPWLCMGRADREVEGEGTERGVKERKEGRGRVGRAVLEEERVGEEEVGKRGRELGDQRERRGGSQIGRVTGGGSG